MAILNNLANGALQCEADMNAAEQKRVSDIKGLALVGLGWLGEAFAVYVEFMKSGWFEAFEHQERSAEKGVCPLRPLLKKTNELLKHKDQLA